MNNKDTFKILSDRDHILLKNEMYIGSVNNNSMEHFISGKKQSDNIVQGLLKILNEVVDNSVDESIRNNFKSGTKVDVSMDEHTFTVKDNGRGIPSELINGKHRAEWAWCFPRSGTSFNAIQTGPSSHGFGAFLTNIFSKSFVGTSSDGILKVIVEAKNNLASYNVNATKCKDKFTHVVIQPDFERFGLTEFSPIYFDRVKERLRLLSIAYPKIRFTFNGESVSIPFKKYVEEFSEQVASFQTENYQYAFFAHEYDDFTQLTTINGLELFQGGTLTNLFYRNVMSILASILKRKNKIDISVNEIKKSIGFIFVGSNFPNPKFTSQNKEALSNTETELRAYLNGAVDYEKVAKILYKTELVEKIIEAWNAKKEMEAFKTLEKNTKKSKVKSKKYTPTKGNDVSKNILFLTEGASAAGQIKNQRDINIHGVFELKGKMLNVFGMKPHEIIKNEECDTLIKILGLKFDPIFHARTEDGSEIYFKENDVVKVKLMNTKTECKSSYSFEILEQYFSCLKSGKIIPGYKPNTYGTIAIASDSDQDGKHVAGLVYNFLFLWPELFIQNRIKRSDFFMIRMTDKKGKISFTNDPYDDKIKDMKKVDHLKGLGSLREEEIKALISNTYNTWNLITIDNPKCLNIMFNTNEIAARKEALSK